MTEMENVTGIDSMTVEQCLSLASLCNQVVKAVAKSHVDNPHSPNDDGEVIAIDVRDLRVILVRCEDIQALIDEVVIRRETE